MDGKRGGKGTVRKIDLDAFFQLAKDIAPFLLLLLPGFGLVGPQHFSEIPLAKERAPFHAAQGLLYPPGCRVDPICRRGEPQRIIAPAGKRAIDRAPFHAAQGLLHSPGFGIDPMRRIHQGIARHGRLAKNRAPHLIR